VQATSESNVITHIRIIKSEGMPCLLSHVACVYKNLRTYLPVKNHFSLAYLFFCMFVSCLVFLFVMITDVGVS